ncbi:MAG: hypothetical protein U0T36_03935 [Saprospiraceae bacterium]
MSFFINRVSFSVYLTAILFTTLFGQNRGNPFEVKPRLKTMQIVDTFQSITVQVDSTHVPIQQKKIQKDSIQNVSTKEANPFEVDHVPVRKSSIANRTEKLRTQTESTQTSNGFLFWFLLFSCAILAIVINTKSKAIGLLYKSIFNENMLKLFQREESTKVSSYLFLLCDILCKYYGFPLFGQCLLWRQKGIFDFIAILVGVVLIYIIRHLSLKILGYLFSISKSTDLYSFSIMIFNQFLVWP